MACRGKYFDRNPKLRAAGIILEPSCNVGDSLQIHSKEEAAENIMQTKCMKQIQDLREKSFCDVTPFLPDENVSDILSPESKKTRFITFREKFAENMFFKKAELGKCMPLDSKPEDLTNENFTYGHITPVSEGVYELILPKKTAEQINREYAMWHEKYKLSHNHYFPSERIRRPYNDAFKANSIFGKATNADPGGRFVRQCLKTDDHFVVVSKAHKEFKQRTEGPLGISINRSTVMPPADFPGYGSITHYDQCNAHALVENITHCENNPTLIAAITHLNKLRRNLFHRTDFHIFDLKFALQQYDKNSTGYIKFNDILETLHSLDIKTQKEKLRLAMSYYEIIENEGQPNEKISLDSFWKILHVQHPLPSLGQLGKVTDNMLIKDTAYRAFCQDRNKPSATAPLPLKGKKPEVFDDEHTHVQDVISPDIPMHFGLGPSDFEMLRSKDELKIIFNSILGDKFDETWEKVREKVKGDENCKINVNQMREIMTS